MILSMQLMALQFFTAALMNIGAESVRLPTNIHRQSPIFIDYVTVFIVHEFRYARKPTSTRNSMKL